MTLGKGTTASKKGEEEEENGGMPFIVTTAYRDFESNRD